MSLLTGIISVFFSLFNCLHGERSEIPSFLIICLYLSTFFLSALSHAPALALTNSNISLTRCNLPESNWCNFLGKWKQTPTYATLRIESTPCRPLSSPSSSARLVAMCIIIITVYQRTRYFFFCGFLVPFIRVGKQKLYSYKQPLVNKGNVWIPNNCTFDKFQARVKILLCLTL